MDEQLCSLLRIIYAPSPKIYRYKGREGVGVFSVFILTIIYFALSGPPITFLRRHLTNNIDNTVDKTTPSTQSDTHTHRQNDTPYHCRLVFCSFPKKNYPASRFRYQIARAHHNVSALVPNVLEGEENKVI